MRINNKLTGQPAGGGPGPASRLRIRLRHKLPLRIQQMHKHAIVLRQRGHALPNQAHIQWRCCRLRTRLHSEAGQQHAPVQLRLQPRLHRRRCKLSLQFKHSEQLRCSIILRHRWQCQVDRYFPLVLAGCQLCRQRYCMRIAHKVIGLPARRRIQRAQRHAPLCSALRARPNQRQPHPKLLRQQAGSAPQQVHAHRLARRSRIATELQCPQLKARIRKFCERRGGHCLRARGCRLHKLSQRNRAQLRQCVAAKGHYLQLVFAGRQAG